MRITRIDLARYGHFTDFPIDFGVDPAGPNFHIIFGENEAGKSTIRDAFLDFLYGIPIRTPYNFLHDNSVLEIGATVQIGGEEHRLIRRKRNANDLLDIDERPVSENVLRAALGDISRDGYCNMFSLDDDTLEMGGENILKSEGDLGQLLFAAAAGVTGLSKTLEGVYQEAEHYYKPSGRKHELAKLKNELTAFEAKIRELDVQAHQYEKLFKGEEQARESYDAAQKEKMTNTKRAGDLKGLIDALVPWRTYSKTKDSLDELGDAPPLPDGWLAAAETQRQKDVEVRSGLARLTKEIETFEAQIGEISVNDDILNHGEAIDRLQADDLEARYKTANDIGNRERERDALKDQLERRLQELGRSGEKDPSALLLPAAIVAQLRELISRRSGIEAKRDGAAEELDRAKEAVDKAKVSLGTYSVLVDLTRFTSRIEVLRNAADEDRLKALKQVLSTAEEECDDAVSLLAPWHGSPQDLVKAKTPLATRVSGLITRKKKIDEALRDADRESEQLDDEEASLRVDGDVNHGAVENLDDETANKVHLFRDEKWVDHKNLFAHDGPIDATKLASSADAFEAAMAEDDRIRDLRLRASTELAAYRESKCALGRNKAAKERLQEKRTKTDAEGVKLQTEIDGIMSDFGLLEGIPIEDLPQWMDRREEALRRYKAQKKAKEEYEAAETAFEASKTALTDELSKLGIEYEGCSVRELLALCDEAIAEWRRQAADKKSAEESLATAEKALVDRQKRFDAAEVTRNDWLAAWSKTLSASWMGSVDSELSTTAVTENLRVLDDIASALREIRELEDRIKAMKEDREAYQKEVQRLVTATRISPQDDDPLQAADMLRRELAQARRNKERVEEKRKQTDDKLKELGELKADEAEIEDRFSEFTAVFPAESFDELIAAMKRAEKRSSLLEALERDSEILCGLLSLPDIEAVEANLGPIADSADAVSELKAEQQLLASRVETEDNNVRELYAAWKTAERALAAIGGDAEVARLEEQKRALHLEIVEKAKTFLRLSAGVRVVQHAIAQYRDTHRSSMMDQASKAFSLITRGGFSELKALADGDQELLVGIKRSGSSLVASKMSRGTRFQLYLALRVAGHVEFTKHREPLPFFADDILEPFDNPRSKETFSLLNDLSSSGQVIYLTHHEHLCELAKEVCGDRVNIIELPDPLNDAA